MQLDQIVDMLEHGAGLYSHSGKVRPGGVFVAMPGSRVDGARFIDEAVARGARVVVHAQGAPARPVEGVCFVAVPNPVRTLGVLARTALGTKDRMPRVVGVTGTNGKTTIAYLLEYLLARNGVRAGLMGTIGCSWNGHFEPASMTTPDCLSLHGTIRRMVDDQVECVVMEVSSHALDQDRIAGVPVDVGVFSNLTQDHLDYHRTMDAYFAAKARLFWDLERRCAKGAVNVDDPRGRELLAGRDDLLGYGLDVPAELHGTVLDSGPRGMRLAMRYAGQSWELRTGLVGRHNASNLLACQGAGLLLGLTPEQMLVLADAPGAPGRLERVPNSRQLDIFIDYAHTPDALEKVAAALKAMGFARLITVFGCGGDRDATKRPLMGQAVARHADIAILTSDNPRTEDPESILDQVAPGLTEAPQVLREVDRRKAIGLAIERMHPGDALLIAGKGHEDYQIIGTTKTHFSDFEVVREYLA